VFGIEDAALDEVAAAGAAELVPDILVVVVVVFELPAADVTIEEDELKLCKKSLVNTDSASLNLSKSRQHLPSKYFDLGSLS